MFCKSALTCTNNSKTKCPPWDSNPHWIDFESIASTVGLEGLCVI